MNRSFILLFLLLTSCGKLIPNKVSDAIKMKEGENMLVRGIVTHKVNFLLCYYTLADSKFTDEKIIVKCGQTKVNIGDKVTINITPDDIIELDGLKLRQYIELD